MQPKCFLVVGYMLLTSKICTVYMYIHTYMHTCTVYISDAPIPILASVSSLISAVSVGIGINKFQTILVSFPNWPTRGCASPIVSLCVLSIRHGDWIRGAGGARYGR